jgi:hypothetical protein
MLPWIYPEACQRIIPISSDEGQTGTPFSTGYFRFLRRAAHLDFAGRCKKRLSFGRKVVKNMERIPAFGGGKGPLKTFIHSEDGFVPDKKGALV